MHGNMMEELKMTPKTGFRFLKINALSLLTVVVSLLTLFSPSEAEGGFEMFEEICEITGEVKQRFVYSSSFPQLTVVEPLDLEEN